MDTLQMIRHELGFLIFLVLLYDISVPH